MSVQQERERFNAVDAATIASEIGVGERSPGNRSTRFAYFGDDQQFLIVAGAQETTYVDLSLALGMTYRGNRRLVLALPEEHAFATLQRVPWFEKASRPEIWVHDGSTARHHPVPTRDRTIAELAARLSEGETFADELRHAATPTHLGSRSSTVQELVEWATTNSLLDASHRRGERAWHCMGQRVLSIRGTSQGVAVTAGIHYTNPKDAPIAFVLGPGETLTQDQLDSIKHEATAGANARLHGAPPIHRPDEHWLQAVIRRDPSLVGVEQPALREIPAWRPRGGPSDEPKKRWGRGYIDLIGVDGHGDVRVVETKIADNQDDLLILQGLDYYVWSQAYRDVLLTRLGVSHRAEFEIHYVIGDTTDGEVHLSKYTEALARSLDREVRWRFQTVHDWYHGPLHDQRARPCLLPTGGLP